MKAVYIQKGESIDYVNGTNKSIAAGDVVVIGDHIGISGTDIPAGMTGSLHVVGVYELDNTSENGITIGTNVYWDGVGISEKEKTGTGDSAVPNASAGYAIAGARAGDKRIIVKVG